MKISDTIRVTLNHSTAILGEPEASQVADTFQHILLLLIQGPSKRLDDLNLCSQGDIAQLSIWNQALSGVPRSCVTDVIRDQCVTNPEDTAIMSWDGTISYKELNKLSTRLATYLTKLGVGPEIFVPLLFEKSKWAIVALLGVIKAGGAYVFLDPLSPLSRMQSICKDLSSELMITSTQYSSVGKVLFSVTLSLPQDGHFECLEDEQPYIPNKTLADNALYAVFTSGSSGKPKGVVVEHQAFCATAMANGPALNLNSTSRVLQFANYAYDVSNRDILMTLMFGGCICIPSEPERFDSLTEFMCRYQVNWASLTPSAVGLLKPDQTPDLRQLILGGEPMTASHVAVWAKGVKLMNAYGPCECAAITALQPSMRSGLDHMNIGRGVGSVLWIVMIDDHSKLAPIGSVGELVIESAGIGRGYVEDSMSPSPFLTSAKWLEQFRNNSNIRLYKTGDLARYNPDGTVAFVGRKDTQVKLRGQRMELEEVQYHVRHLLHDTVPAIAELISPEGSSLTKLVVFIALSHEVLGRLSQELIEGLAKYLPPHMMPSALIPLDRIPMTATGKTDRRRLRTLGASLTMKQLADLRPLRVPRREGRAPATEMERRLQMLWASVLNIDDEAIEVDDNFLEIGGDSIAIIRLVNAARENGLLIATVDVFQTPCLKDLAQSTILPDDSQVEVITPFSLLQSDIDLNDARVEATTRCMLKSTDYVEDIMPCTPLQEGLMAMTSRKPGNYIFQTILQLTENVDIDRLRDSWANVASMTPILRTRIVELPRQGLVQVVVREEFQWSQSQDLNQYLYRDMQERVGLGTRLVRFGLIQDLAAGRIHLVWSMHHALFDGWCKSMMLDLVQKFYAAQEVKPLAPFRNYLHYIRQPRENETAYWQAQLADLNAPTFPPLPTRNYQPQADRSHEHCITSLVWPRSENVTASTIIRASWAILVACYTDVQDVIFGATVSGRQVPVPSIDRIGGPTIATVPVRVKLDSEIEIKELLHQVQSQAVEMIPFEHTGLQHIRQISPACQFQTILVIQPPSSSIVEEGPLFRVVGTSIHDEGLSTANTIGTDVMILECELMPKGVTLRSTYDSQMVDTSQMSRIMRLMEHILRQVCATQNRRTRLQDLDIVSPGDMGEIWTWNGTLPHVSQDCLHDMIVTRARQQPNAPAVCACDGNLTYAELDRFSTNLALQMVHYHHVGRGSIVPLYLEKSMWMPVAMLGVMKAGGASVAIDVSQTVSRLRAIMQKIQPDILLTSFGLKDSSKSFTSATTLVVSNIAEEGLAPGQRDRIQLPEVASTDKLYLAFTSGSTGNPKGAILTHQNVTTSISHQQRLLNFTTSSRVLDFASYSFDVAWLNFFHTFTSGACLCVPSESARKNNLDVFIREKEVTLACLTPSIARLLDPAKVPSLRILILLGEPMQTRDVITWASRLKLKNWYGPAECVASTIQEAVTSPREVNNIGRGFGVNTWIVTLSGRCLAPIGAIGELWLEGPLVGEGYIGDSEKTAVNFEQDPAWFYSLPQTFRKVNGKGRLYRTGDLVRYQSDGTIAILGRRDAQVKIRGKRLELDEVEYFMQKSLADSAEVQVVAEVITPQGGVNPILALFMAVGERAAGSPEGVRALLQELTKGTGKKVADNLPDHMIPGLYIALDTIPITITGKTDRKRVREIGESMTLEQLMELQPAREKSRAPPETEMERCLQSLWAAILGLTEDSIGRDDSFLQIGGDSIGAMRLVAHASQRGLSMSVVDVFTSPQLHEMALIVKVEDRVGHIMEPFSLLPSTIDVHNAQLRAAKICSTDVSQIEDIFPCTSLQEGLLAMTTRFSGDYVDRIVLKLRHEIDIMHFRRAWEEVVAARAPIVRTRILDLPDAGLFQVIVAQDMEWTAHDSLEACLLEYGQDLFGLGTPLARFSIVQERGDAFFVWTQHHALYDGFSTSLILEEAERTYCGDKATLNLVPFQSFIQYVTHLKGADSFWYDQLQGSDTRCFPTLPDPQCQPSADRIYHHSISALQWPKSDITASSIIRAAWAILLARYTNSTDVIYGDIVNGRQAPVLGIERVMGPTIATVPVRVQVRGDQSIRLFVREIQRQQIDMIPFEQTGLQQIRRISPDTAQACQFQSILVMQPTSKSSKTKDQGKLFEANDFGLSIEERDRLNVFNSYALMLVCELDGDSMHLRISFDSYLVPPKQIEMIAHQLEHALRQVCEDKEDILVKEIGHAGECDLSEIWRWNGVTSEAVSKCVHDYISIQSQQRPNAPAVCGWDGDFTYGELDALSTQLAYSLERRGMGKNMIIPLCFEKSKWMPIAMLGVMKIGAASVALDINLPKERLRMIIHQVKSSAILCSAANHSLAAQMDIETVQVVDESLRNIRIANDRNLPIVDPSALLCVVYTSGSTGIPKGAMLSHSNFSSAIEYQQRALGFDSSARVFDFASYAFDAAWSNFIHSASSGACLCIPSESARKDDIGGAMNHMAVTYADLTPSTAQLLDPVAIPTLSTLVLAGEPIKPQDIALWCSRLRLKNTYGPAECTVTATACDLIETSESVGNIGSGVGVTTWVVDPMEGAHLLPIGGVGELWIEGPLVGQGYLGDPEKTAASFVEDPVWLLRGGAGHRGRHGRLYKTGDLVRYDPDGTLIFVGRKNDSQVKIRGQRVELGEIEHQVQRCFSGCGHVAAEVVQPKDAKRAPLLVAFIVCAVPGQIGDNSNEAMAKPDEAFRLRVLAAKGPLTEILPSYMVPAVFLPLHRMPLTASGKVDRRWLREQAAGLSWSALMASSHELTEKRLPSTEIEVKLQQLWGQVLNVETEEIGVDDSFFRLGGDSISAMRLSAKCLASGFRVTVSQVFDQKTIARIALCATGTKNSMIDYEEKRDVPFALSPIQQMFFETQSREYNSFTQSFLLELSKPLIVADLRKAIGLIVGRHSMLRARFSRLGDNDWTQQIHSKSDGCYVLQEYTVPTLRKAIPAMDATQKSLDITSGPLFAADIIHVLGGGQHLFLVAHHLVIDLVSWRIVLEDLEGLLTNGNLSGPVPLSFETWCRLQEEYSRNHLIAETALPFELIPSRLDYWGSGWRQNAYGDVHEKTFTINKQMTELLLGPANGAFDTQPVELFQAVLCYSLARTFPDHPAFTIFNEGHGREPWDDAIDISRTVGWFTTIWPTIITVDKEDDIKDTLRRTKDSRRAIPNNGWAYFSSRYLNRGGKKAFGTRDPVEILFNYEGLYQQLDQRNALFRRVDLQTKGPREAIRNLQRSALIEVTGSVVHGELQFTFWFNRFMSRQDAILKWISHCEQGLNSLAVQLPTLKRSFSLCDFPFLNLDYENLDEMVNNIVHEMDVSPGDIEDAYPCLSMQDLMLESNSEHPQQYATSYVGKIRTVKSAQPIDMKRLKKAWTKLINRHTSLRTRFVMIGNRRQWAQVVLKKAVVKFHDLNHTQADDPLEELIAQRPLKMSVGSVPHLITLTQTSPSEVLFRLDVSHAIMDAISRAVLFREWSLFYEGRDPSGMAVPFGQHVKSFLSDGARPSIDYWSEYLKNCRPCMFPTCITSDDRRLGNLRTARVDWGQSAALCTFARRQDVTIPTVIKTIWAVILQDWVGTDSVCFGYLDSGRSLPVAGIQGIVGAVLNLLVCSIGLEPHLRIEEIWETIHRDYHRSVPHGPATTQSLRSLGLMPPSEHLFNTTINYRREQQPTDQSHERSELAFDFISGQDGMEVRMSVSIHDDFLFFYTAANDFFFFSPV